MFFGKIMRKYFLMILRVEMGHCMKLFEREKGELFLDGLTSDVFNIFFACHSASMFCCFHKRSGNNQFLPNTGRKQLEKFDR